MVMSFKWNEKRLQSFVDYNYLGQSEIQPSSLGQQGLIASFQNWHQNI